MSLNEITEQSFSGLNLKRNIGYLFLDIENKYFEVSDFCYRLLDDIISVTKEKIDLNEDTKKILENIHYILKYDIGLDFIKEDDISSFLRSYSLCLSIESRELYCDAASIIHLTIAEELGIPLKAVRAPGHIFVRFENNKTKFNWETIEAWSPTDEEYKKDSKIHQKSIDRGVYLKSLSKKETLSYAYFNLAKRFESEGSRFEEAIKNYNEAISLNPNFTEAYYNKGLKLIDLDRYVSAIKSYNKAIEIDPYFEDAYTDRGFALAELGRTEEAIKSCETAIEYCPYFALAYNYKGKFLSELGKHEEGIKYLEKAIELQPTNEYHKIILVELFVELGRPEEGINILEKAIELQPENEYLKISLGELFVELGRPEEGIKILEKAIELQPENEIYKYHLERIRKLIK